MIHMDSIRSKRDAELLPWRPSMTVCVVHSSADPEHKRLKMTRKVSRETSHAILVIKFTEVSVWCLSILKKYPAFDEESM